MIELCRELNGNILDIGGGGEGIIGRLYREQVIAIDNRQDELDEAPDGFEKLLMDATDLRYADSSFDHVTFFFALMFMSTEDQKQAIMEAARVLKDGGEIHIWDCDIASAYPEPFCVDVEIQLPNEHITTTYGVGKLDTQDISSITKMCEDAGLTAIAQSEKENYFHMVLQKNVTRDPKPA